MPIDYYGAHSIVFIHSQTFAFDDIVPPGSEKNYYHSWLDFHMVPSVRPHIETPEPEIIMYSDTVSSKVFDLTNARLGFQKFSSLKGQWEFIIDHDRWTDWVAAKAAIEDYFNGRRIMCALMDDPTVAYFGRAFLSNWDDGEDYSRVTIYYDFNYESKLINIDFLNPESITASLRSDAPTFILGDTWKKVKPYISVVAIYANGRQSEVEFIFSGGNEYSRLMNIGTNIIKINHKGHTADIYVNAVEGTVASISHIWKGVQSSIFNLGDYKNSITNRIDLTVTYTNGYSRTIDGTNADYISGRFTTLTDSMKQTVTYKGKTTDATVSVVEGTVASISHTWKSGQSSTFNLGDYKDSIRDRINLNVTYTNGYSRTIDGTNADYISGRFEDPSQTTQAVGYRGKTGNVQVKVYEGAPISITASYKTSPPHQFVIGQSKDSIRQYINITITYNNDSPYSRTIDGSNAQFISGTFSSIGIEPITITYTNSSGSKSTTINASVVERQISSISVNYKTGENSVFAINDSKDLLRQRINIIVTYNDGTTETINGTNADQIIGTFSTAGTQSVTISYNGKSTNINATVVIPVIYHFSVDGNGNTTITEASQITSNDTARITYGENYNVIVPNGTVGTLTYGFSVNDNGDIIVGNAITGVDSVTISNGNTFDLAIVVIH